jgi:hypothetical protein
LFIPKQAHIFKKPNSFPAAMHTPSDTFADGGCRERLQEPVADSKQHGVLLCGGGKFQTLQ